MIQPISLQNTFIGKGESTTKIILHENNLGDKK